MPVARRVSRRPPYLRVELGSLGGKTLASNYRLTGVMRRVLKLVPDTTVSQGSFGALLSIQAGNSRLRVGAEDLVGIFSHKGAQPRLIYLSAGHQLFIKPVGSKPVRQRPVPVREMYQLELKELERDWDANERRMRWLEERKAKLTDGNKIDDLRLLLEVADARRHVLKQRLAVVRSELG